MASPSSGQMRSVTLMRLRLRRGCLPSSRALHRRAHVLAAVHFAVPIGITAAVGHLAVVHGLAARMALARHLVPLVGLRLGRHSAVAHGSVLRGACGYWRRCWAGLRSSGRGESKSRRSDDKDSFHVDSPDGLMSRLSAHAIAQESWGGRGTACGLNPLMRRYRPG